MLDFIYVSNLILFLHFFFFCFCDVYFQEMSFFTYCLVMAFQLTIVIILLSSMWFFPFFLFLSFQAKQKKKLERFWKFQIKMFTNTLICFWSIWTKLIFFFQIEKKRRERMWMKVCFVYLIFLLMCACVKYAHHNNTMGPFSTWEFFYCTHVVI